MKPNQNQINKIHKGFLKAIKEKKRIYRTFF